MAKKITTEEDVLQELQGAFDSGPSGVIDFFADLSEELKTPKACRLAVELDAVKGSDDAIRFVPENLKEDVAKAAGINDLSRFNPENIQNVVDDSGETAEATYEKDII